MSRLRLAIAAVAVLSLTACFIWAPALSRKLLRDEIVYARTADGWDIAMHHYRAGPGFSGSTSPVIICHGISANERSWSLDENRSLPRYLARLGWDVWAIDLRGVGESQKPGWFDGKDYSYPFDVYGAQDLPAVIDEVIRRTGAYKVNWIGHSMGGMVAYAYVARYGDSKLKTVTTVGSPVAFEGANQLLAWARPYAAAVGPYLPSIREEWVPLSAPVIGPFQTRLEYFLWNFDNLDTEAARAMVYNGTSTIAGGVLRQFADIMATGKFRSADGSLDYLEGLNRLTVPFQIMAGMADNLALPQNIMPAYFHAASKDKRFRVFARANGDEADYGHNDMPVGNASIRDVYPEIERWMKARQ